MTLHINQFNIQESHCVTIKELHSSCVYFKYTPELDFSRLFLTAKYFCSSTFGFHIFQKKSSTQTWSWSSYDILPDFIISNLIVWWEIPTLFIHPIMTTSWWSYYSLIGLNIQILLVSNYLEIFDAQRLWSSYTLIHLWADVVSLIYILSSCNNAKS